ncbi:1-acyl-sn-glycerol-3-phosphate acyltransferase [candidate division KSB1 bacterium]|nr:1-acyl-sn-glycerol-3-phosphate acyltransferase [candidate division KSB1 bacterium]
MGNNDIDNVRSTKRFSHFSLHNFLANFRHISSNMLEAFLRCVTSFLMHLSYRIRKNRLHNIPAKGPALLVCNHVSFVDALLISASVRRPVRFVMDHKIFDAPILGLLFRAAKVIPIARARENPQILQQAFCRITSELKAGNLVCIFPEGQITRDGNLNPFREGFVKIVQSFPVCVIPMGLRGMWGSFFSRKYGSAMHSLPRRFRSHVELCAGKPIPPEKVNVCSTQAVVEKLLQNSY